MNPAKLKVVELRSELSARGLDTKGNKAVLVERLQEALDAEGGGGEAEEEKQDDEPEEQTLNQTSIEQEQEESQEPTQAPAQTAEPSPSPQEVPEEQETEPAPSQAERESSPQKATTPQKEPTPKKEITPQRDQRETTPQRLPQEESTRQQTPELDTEQMEVDEGKTDVSVKEEPDEEDEKRVNVKTEDPQDLDHGNQGENGEKEGFEEDVKPDIKNEEDIKMEDDAVKTEHSENRDRKRKRSSSPRRKPAMEWEPELKENEITLSWYDSDLNLTIDDKRFLSATPMSDGGFGYVWAGVRGTHGYTSGSLCYQVKVTNFLDVSHLEDEPNPNVLRVGWSTFTSSLQLGEEPFSYGYGGTGKFSVNCKFSDFGEKFGLNDVITCYLEFTDDEVVISYGLNDDYLGVATRFAKTDLDGKALAPHILTKNAGFSVNFGEEETPWKEVKEGFTFLSKHPVEETSLGPRRPEKRSDCEMIMMCGLPACGKTTWASKYALENPEKNYNILGTNALIDKMKVMGLPRKANYSGRWDVLIEKCTKCLQRLMDIGCHRRRNYILDQTNVFPAAQRRKMRNFEGFTRKAVVIVPTDEEFKSRVDKQANEEKKDVPESAVLEMKANFTLPDKNIFDEVIFVELQEEEASALVQKYAKEANEKGFLRKSGPPGGGPPNKRFRGGDFHHKGDFRRDRFGPPGGPGSPFRRGSDRGGPRGGGGGWGGGRGGGPVDRWRDNRNQGGYGRPSHGDRSGWRGPSSGGPPGSNRGPRDFDRGPPRRGGFDRNDRSGGPGGRTGGGFNNRDNRDRRGPPPNAGMGGKPRQGDAPRNAGGQGGNQAAPAQWNNHYGQNQGQVAAPNNQAWGQQAQWGQHAQAWNNYQQQWKGYQQGYNQQGYSQGYNNTQQYNWQQYYGNYNQQGGWGQQNSDGTYNYPQSWQNWYAAQNAGQSNTTQPPPSAK